MPEMRFAIVHYLLRRLVIAVALILSAGCMTPDGGGGNDPNVADSSSPQTNDGQSDVTTGNDTELATDTLQTPSDISADSDGTANTPDTVEPPDGGDVDDPWACWFQGVVLEEPLPKDVNPTKKGRQTLNFKYNGFNRPYVLHIPQGYNNQAPRPLLFAFHGGNWKIDAYYKSFQELKTAAEAANIIYVMPQGIGETWHAPHCCGKALACDIDDVGYVRALATYLQSVLKIDPQRIYATGHSNGGMFSHALAAAAPDLFAGVGPGAGTIGGKATPIAPTAVIEPTGPIPMFIYHGLRDGSVPYNGDMGTDMEGRNDISFEKSVGLWLKTNGCDPQNVSVVWDGPAKIETYNGCTHADVVAVSILRWGHGRPVDVEGFNYLVPLFKFFADHPKPLTP